MSYYRYFLDKVSIEPDKLKEEMLQKIYDLENALEEMEYLADYYKRQAEDYLERVEELQEHIRFLEGRIAYLEELRWK